MEAKVAEEGIILARDLGLSEVIMEGDALTMMSALSGLNPPSNSIQKVVEGSIRLLQSFKEWEAIYASKCSNAAAHQLARQAKSESDRVDTPPPPPNNRKPSLYGCIFNEILPQLMNLRMN